MLGMEYPHLECSVVVSKVNLWYKGPLHMSIKVSSRGTCLAPHYYYNKRGARLHRRALFNHPDKLFSVD